MGCQLTAHWSALGLLPNLDIVDESHDCYLSPFHLQSQTLLVKECASERRRKLLWEHKPRITTETEKPTQSHTGHLLFTSAPFFLEGISAGEINCKQVMSLYYSTFRAFDGVKAALSSLPCHSVACVTATISSGRGSMWVPKLRSESGFLVPSNRERPLSVSCFGSEHCAFSSGRRNRSLQCGSRTNFLSALLYANIRFFRWKKHFLRAIKIWGRMDDSEKTLIQTFLHLLHPAEPPLSEYFTSCRHVLPSF